MLQSSIIQHQLRGSVQILDDCTFQVTLSNFTWDQFRVLGIWDVATASDFGHILLEPVVMPDSGIGAGMPDVGSGLNISPSPSPLPSDLPAPSPAPVPSEDQGVLITHGLPQPTMFDNCIQLNAGFRVRWTVNWGKGSVDIGLETVLTKSEYMAFGWAPILGRGHYMINSDVVVAGFDEQEMPYAEDYFISAYSPCNWDSRIPNGVCPDKFFAQDNERHVNDSTLMYGQQVDGISLIRYSRPLESGDSEYDIPIDLNANMRVIWARGVMKPPDSLVPNYTPQNHYSPWGTTYGWKNITLGDPVDECVGPLAASEVYQGDIVVADRGVSLVIGSVESKHYPNPPSPKKVLSINQKEAPLLKVERGVPVKISVQAGYDVPFYITSDAIGGRTNGNETIYAGGPETFGVPVLPHLLTWLPNSSTPDHVFYQSYSQPKMGWKVQVVDGGLSDMYNSSALLDLEQVTLFWTLSSDEISFAVRGEKKSGYLAIAFGSGMVNSFAYVGWIDENGVGKVSTYWIDGKEPSKVHATSESLSGVRCTVQDGRITFEFTRPLLPGCVKGAECKNVIETSDVLKVVWAMGASWTADSLTTENMHSSTSSKPLLVHLTTGEAKTEDLVPVFAVHGFMMFLAWGLLFPGGVLAARYLKHLEHQIWFQVHMFSQYSGLVVMLLGLLFAVAELGGFYMRNAHMKVGMASIVLACWQPMNAYFRPPKPPFGEPRSLQRAVWEYVHIYSGRVAVVLGAIALITGISQLSETDNLSIGGYRWALVAWILTVGGLVAYMETKNFTARKQQQGGMVYNSWTTTETDEIEEEDTRNLLQSGTQTKEVQLFPLRAESPPDQF